MNKTYLNRHMHIPAVWVLLRDGDKILLLRRYKTGWRDGDYTLPSGHFEAGETATQAAVREIKEEVGVTVSVEDLEFAAVINRIADEQDHERIDFFFEAKKFRGTPRLCEPEKCDDVGWFDSNNLPDNVVPPVFEALRLIKNNRHYSEQVSASL